MNKRTEGKAIVEYRKGQQKYDKGRLVLRRLLFGGKKKLFPAIF